MTVLSIVFNTVAIFIAVIVVIRLNGLRSFSKMSSFDFAVSVAIGSIVASVSLGGAVSFFDGLIGLLAIYLCQRVVSHTRVHQNASRLVDNRARLIMVGDRFLETALTEERITIDDLRAKLRESNVTDYSQVKAVVLESTGDISVLHGPPDEKLDFDLLKNVKGAEEYVGG